MQCFGKSKKPPKVVETTERDPRTLSNIGHRLVETHYVIFPMHGQCSMYIGDIVLHNLKFYAIESCINLQNLSLRLVEKSDNGWRLAEKGNNIRISRDE